MHELASIVLIASAGDLVGTAIFCLVVGAFLAVPGISGAVKTLLVVGSTWAVGVAGQMPGSGDGANPLLPAFGCLVLGIIGYSIAKRLVDSA